MGRLGAHMSIAGGLPKAVERAVAHGCAALQIFAKNASQWQGRTIPPEEIREFRARVTAASLAPVVSHASYLINLASTDAGLRRRSIAAMVDELDRAEALGLLGVVLHPGCSPGGGRGLQLVADALLDVLSTRPRSRAMVILEHTAGQGTSLGSSFEEIAAIIEGLQGNRRVGVCLDTCHLVASGYDIATPSGYASTFDRFGQCIGFDRLMVFHLNDSKRPLGSRVDRHTHIGEGHVGLEAFRRLVNDQRFAHLPMLLETPKTEGRQRTAVEIDRLDEKNLSTLRSLLAQ